MQRNRRNLGLSLSHQEHGRVVHRKQNTGAGATLVMSLGKREWQGDSADRKGKSINLEAKFQKTEQCHKSQFCPYASPTMLTPSWTRSGTLPGAVLQGHSSLPYMLHRYRGRGAPRDQRLAPQTANTHIFSPRMGLLPGNHTDPK